jgi:glycosyltransferase involved in cell wall biosynthesis
MCTFNREELIADSIQSCVNQTLKNWELIIVDDYSSDNTESVVASFNDSRIVYIKCDSHVGRSRARNIGLERSRGEYLSFLDSDDLFSANKIAKDIEILSESNSELAIYTGAQCLDITTGKILGYYYAEKSGDLYSNVAFYLPLVIATSQLTMTRKVYEMIGGFDETLDRFEDTDYFRRISRVTHWKANPDLLVTLKNHLDNVISNQSQVTIIEMIERYVSKVDDEIRDNHIITEAKSTSLYLHYAQALFVQKNGLKNSLRLYKKALRTRPQDSLTILLSLLKILKRKVIVRSD